MEQRQVEKRGVLSPVRVLLVEDNPGDVALFLESLREDSQWPAIADVTTSLSQAIEHLPRVRPDVVFLDLGLPDSTGTHAVVTLRKADPVVPIIVFNGDDDLFTAQSCIEAGADDYIVLDHASHCAGRIAHIAVIRAASRKSIQAQSIFESAHDATEKIRLEQERSQALSDTEALVKATNAVLDAYDFDQAARAVFDTCSKHIGAPAGYLALLNAKTQNNDVLFLESGGLPCSVDPALPMPVRGLRAKAYCEQRVVFENNFRDSQYQSELPQGHVVLENVLFAPLLVAGQSVGLIGFSNKPGGFTQRDARMVEAFAEVAAIALRENTNKRQLRENEERLRAVFQATADYVMLLDPKHRVQDINKTEPGVKREMILGRPLYEFVDQDDRERVKRVLDSVVALGETRQYDTEYTRPDGERIYFQSVVSPVALTESENGSVVVSRNVSEQRHIEAQLAQADRLSSMGMLAAGVAHEINNPLAYILFNLENLSDELPRLINVIRYFQARVSEILCTESLEEIVGDMAPDMTPAVLGEIQDRVRDALKGTRRIRDIVRGLSTFSRVECDQQAPVHLMYVIEAALNMCFNEIKYRARVVKDYGKVPVVMASEGRLSQVFLNLFLNAAHAIDEGDVEGNEIRVRTWAEEDSVYAEVSDTGEGIEPKHLEHLFEPFFTTKEIGVGSGLGLSISKRIIEGYGGTITVKSEVNKGTVFKICIPVCNVKLTPSASASEVTKTTAVKGRVLIVDDEVGIRSALSRMLREHEIVEADTGEAARNILTKDQEFDLILCDMMMPKVSGMDLHRWLSEINPPLSEQLIFITGGAFTPRAQKYLKKVKNLRLEKPFDVANFRKIVEKMIRDSKLTVRDSSSFPSTHQTTQDCLESQKRT